MATSSPAHATRIERSAPKTTKEVARFADTDLVGQTRILTTGELIAFLAKFQPDTPITGPTMNELLIGEWSDAILQEQKILLFDETKRPRIK